MSQGAFEAMRTYEEIADGIRQREGPEAAENYLRARRQEMGGTYGALYGAAAGAAVGSAVPVVGTIVGGVLGGILGAIGGSKL